jgi:hypothetical protein
MEKERARREEEKKNGGPAYLTRASLRECIRDNAANEESKDVDKFDRMLIRAFDNLCRVDRADRNCKIAKVDLKANDVEGQKAINLLRNLMRSFKKKTAMRNYNW